MAYFDGTIFSEALGMMVSVIVCVPANSPYIDAQGNVPVITVLHGLSDNRTAWIRRTNIELYAEQRGVALVIPEVQRSFYADMHKGIAYYRYISQELPDQCCRMFHLSKKKEDNYLMGISMGGYGTLKLAFRQPERYEAVAAFSSAVDVEKRLLSPEAFIGQGEREAITGDHIADENNLFFLAEKAPDKEALPRIFMTCGKSDYMYEDNRRFCRHLDAQGVPYTYEEWEGGHDWRFWEASVQKAMPFFLDGRK